VNKQIEEKDQERKKRKPTKESEGRPPGMRAMRMTMMKMFFLWYVTYMTSFKIQLMRWFLRCSAMGVPPDAILAVHKLLEENNVPDRWLCMRCSEVWC